MLKLVLVLRQLLLRFKKNEVEVLIKKQKETIKSTAACSVEASNSCQRMGVEEGEAGVCAQSRGDAQWYALDDQRGEAEWVPWAGKGVQGDVESHKKNIGD